MELLGILQEECAEIIQIISKIRRFGINSFNPGDPDAGTNFELLNLETADALALVEMLKETEDSPLSEELIERRVAYKKTKVLRYLRTPI
jgi:NTP pyrophosphatase (non-canonical NTP hydrolase)